MPRKLVSRTKWICLLLAVLSAGICSISWIAVSGEPAAEGISLLEGSAGSSNELNLGKHKSSKLAVIENDPVKHDELNSEPLSDPGTDDHIDPPYNSVQGTDREQAQNRIDSPDDAGSSGAFWANVMQQKFEEVKGGSEYLRQLRSLHDALKSKRDITPHLNFTSIGEMKKEGVDAKVINNAHAFIRRLVRDNTNGRKKFRIRTSRDDSSIRQIVKRQDDTPTADKLCKATTKSECERVFKKCNNHGTCLRKETYDKKSCYICACNTYDDGSKVDPKIRAQKWTGESCKYKDISVQFNLFLWLSIAMVSTLFACVFLFIDLGKETPAIPSSGYARPKVE